jgi:hypothetical protein
LRTLKDHAKARITQLDATQSNGSLHAGTELWLACSQERRVSVWTADWSRDFNELVDWLTFPAPAFEPSTACPSMPPTLAQFVPNNSDLILTTCYSTSPKLLLYSLIERTFVRSIVLPRFAVCMASFDRLLTLVDVAFQDFADAHAHRVGHCRMVDSSQAVAVLSSAGHGIAKWDCV